MRSSVPIPGAVIELNLTAPAVGHGRKR
jgi:hypothetical protein